VRTSQASGVRDGFPTGNVFGPGASNSTQPVDAEHSGAPSPTPVDNFTRDRRRPASNSAEALHAWEWCRLALASGDLELLAAQADGEASVTSLGA